MNNVLDLAKSRPVSVNLRYINTAYMLNQNTENNNCSLNHLFHLKLICITCPFVYGASLNLKRHILGFPVFSHIYLIYMYNQQRKTYKYCGTSSYLQFFISTINRTAYLCVILTTMQPVVSSTIVFCCSRWADKSTASYYKL